jgi:hypothetical protein
MDDCVSPMRVDFVGLTDLEHCAFERVLVEARAEPQPAVCGMSSTYVTQVCGGQLLERSCRWTAQCTG